MRNLLIIFYVLCGLHFWGFSQQIENNRKTINRAQNKLKNALDSFFSECLIEDDCNECVEELMKSGNDVYSKYLVGGALYNIDSEKSFQLHKEAYELKKNELNFNLEYAIELHRVGAYREAIPHYLVYQNSEPEDYRIDVWLSECYLNADSIEKSIEHWKRADHYHNHTGIDKAVHVIHGRTDQIKRRSVLREQILQHNARSVYELIYMDRNWEFDWWNIDEQIHFLNSDKRLALDVFGEDSPVYHDIIAYCEIKTISEEFDKSDSMKTVFEESNLIIDGGRFVSYGKMSSDLIRIALMYDLIEEERFFNSRGAEILSLASELGDGELLNIYAYLEAKVKGKVSKATDLKGWKEFGDERFAVSYFLGLAEQNTFDNPSLQKALEDFPNSSKLQWIKLNCAIIEGKPTRKDLIELMKREFRTLGSDSTRFSYELNRYFYFLENGFN
jgi:hypothetical protein